MGEVDMTSGCRSVGLILLSALLATMPASADGGFFAKQAMLARVPVSAPAQKGVVIRDRPGREILLLQTTYRGPSAEFAWVIPVPGLPRKGGVFLANPRFLDGLDSGTRPMVRTELQDPLDFEDRHRPGRAMMGGMPPGMAGGSPGTDAPQVRVHERMAVGDYDAAILSATGPGVLAQWLRRHGYAFPEKAGPIAERYVARRWYFVALRIRPPVQSGAPVLTDVAPIGIRFAAERLVYPLTISRASAGPVTTLLLWVIGGAGVECAQLPTVQFPVLLEAGRGTTYASVARGLLKQHAGKALLCESRQPLARVGGLWDAFVRMKGPYGDHDPKLLAISRDARVVLAPGDRVVTRLAGELPLDALVDLTFRPAAGTHFVLRATRKATLLTPRWAYCFGTRTAQAAWVLAALALVLLALWPRPAVPVPEETASSLGRAATRAAAALGLVALWLTLAPRLLDPQEAWQLGHSLSRGIALEFRFLAEAALALCLVPAGILLPRLTRRLPQEVLPGALSIFAGLIATLVCAALVLVPAVRRYGQMDLESPLLAVLAALGLAALCWPLSLALVFWGRLTSRRAGIGRAIAWSLLSLLLLVPLVRGACALAVEQLPRTYEVLSSQEQALTRIETALKLFHDSTGAYPTRLQDLAAEALPAQGMDAFGRPVRLAGAPPMPLLPALPLDPVTGRSDTWVYDVRSPYLVESGAYEWEIETVAQTTMVP